MQHSGKQLLEALQQAPWGVAARAYGNSHATLIGLLVQWWITADPAARSVVEGGPSFDTRRQGVGGGICDALFCAGDDAVGVLEVEGTRGTTTATKIGSFFPAAYPSLERLQFGILLLYAYEPRGAGINRRFSAAGDAATLTAVAQVSQAYPEKPLLVITLDKTYARQSSGIRAQRILFRQTQHRPWLAL
jgi:hypothetical protein